MCPTRNGKAPRILTLFLFHKQLTSEKSTDGIKCHPTDSYQHCTNPPLSLSSKHCPPLLFPQNKLIEARNLGENGGEEDWPLRCWGRGGLERERAEKRQRGGGHCGLIKPTLFGHFDNEEKRPRVRGGGERQWKEGRGQRKRARNTTEKEERSDGSAGENWGIFPIRWVTLEQGNEGSHFTSSKWSYTAYEQHENCS